ncbi:aminotransferase class I/II-fold pyridoxal phosphate-dependent enzyme [Capnocytophaga catalasegens]|uniref:8-amino-7-oxononanoate synthase n=1 Tax=Capnocytophaga catalasegens TaxID=1004260 RepID=A0AAV5AYW3_9FLAO|nr:8-amino-7-oxononanoate synthase [Capnocytophaga catalasegens]GIZ15938.1 8-amino-7-oxononanoate synthase [Capnocytophaga catalasegens]GJM50002.1 8-amino-7-oxononanoate synthase [Capnocytophaga catalasegens]GJM54106.1 8-amino-7-oxononanoate synthase [Capnocytophaga catalasegens]
MKIPKSIYDKLNQRKEENALRELSSEAFPIDFWSNDYLGFARSEVIQIEAEAILKKLPLQNGATGSRLISGNHPLYTQAESFLSSFHKSEGVLIFNSGYDANLGVFSSIPQRNDLILYDQYIHTSIRDGISLSHAKALKFKHNDLSHLEELLSRYTPSYNAVYVATESVFSMDGDSPNLEQMVLLCKKYKAFLIVDEAHAIGIYGKNGEGLVQHLSLQDSIFIRLVTFGKALGSHGAAILAHKEVISYLTNFARSFIYTTGLPPQAIAYTLASYKLLTDSSCRDLLHANIHLFQTEITQLGLSHLFISSESPIQAMKLSSTNLAKSYATNLQQQGIGIKPILAPTVPKNEERLRICLHAFNTKHEINQLLTQIAQIKKSYA